MPQLNPQQLAAVRHTDGPLLILAGAGTGKTRVVTERMARLLREGTPPRALLGVTFTNKAAGEMRSRLAALTHGMDLRELILSTFHSLAVRIIRRNAADAGLTPSFSICDTGEQLSIIRKAASTVRAHGTVKPEDLLSLISRLKNKGITADDFRRQAVDDDELYSHAIYRRYQEALRLQNCLDFDDLLLESLRIMQRNPEAAGYWRDRFAYIMVDEFQDTNAVQFELVRELAAPRNNVCVVGDDDQSIYSWRGAMAGNILRFSEYYPNAKIITLEQNYRSTSVILSAANAVISNNQFRRPKKLWSALGQGAPVRLTEYQDQLEEAEAIARDIARRVRDQARERGTREDWTDHAVIIRANSQAKPLEDAFTATRIPFEVIGGQSVFDRKEMRDILSFLAIIANPGADNQLLRIINVPARGISEKTVQLLAAHATRTHARLSAVLAAPERVEGLPPKAAAACSAFAAQIAGWRKQVEQGRLDTLVQTILDDVEYGKELAHLYHDPLQMDARRREAEAVGDSLAAFWRGNPDLQPAVLLAEFVNEALLGGRGREDAKKSTNKVRIITVHSAKGMEFPIVYLPGLEDGMFPHKNSLEQDGESEERRLFYVALTRARQELHLSRSRGHVARGKTQPCEPGRFLAEIPAELVQTAVSTMRADQMEESFSKIQAILSKKSK